MTLPQLFRTLRRAAPALALALVLAACDVGAFLPATATPPPAPPPTATDVPIVAPTNTPAAVGNGTVTGALGYPSEFIPAMKLYFQNTDTADVLTLSTSENQSSYSKTLPPGTYHVYAWLEGFGLGGAYTAAVPCGLSADCTDHSLLPVEVAPGATVENINITDWYGPPGSVPLPPGSNAPTAGRIEGTLSYPSEGIPPLLVHARNIATQATLLVPTSENQQQYVIENVPPGVYHVFAWVSDGNGPGGAYTQFVLCGLTADCTDHSLIEVPVIAGQTTSGVDIADWYEQSVVPLP